MLLLTRVTQIRDDTSLLIRLVNEQTRQNKHIHDDSINAVQSLKHDLLTIMQQHWDSALQSHDISFRKIGDQLASLAQRCTAHEKSERILQSLYCEEVHSRELGVSDAVDCTFDWAFNAWCSGTHLDCGCRCTGKVDITSEYRCSDHAGSLQRPCNGLARHQKHLLDWLETKTSEPFIVTGKPGSGKSTFMKFVASHEQTRLALTGWAGDKKLLVANFYFWSSGSPLQRSQEGLLRCLLYQILSQAPEMIPIAVPRRWQAAGDTSRTTEPWTRKEISDAFSGIFNGNPLDVNICFFIDGLDEYGGSDLTSGESDLELVAQLKKVASSPHIKLCLSSRPRNVFQNHLVSDESRHITLQNHTSKDIENFVQLRIESVRQLINIDPSDLKELQSMIAERSSGVFLWVVLVVRELLDGLEPSFSMPEMEERLSSLPESLDGFFQRILDKVHRQYRRFTARVLLASMRRPVLDLETVYFLWLQDRTDVYSRETTVAQYQHSHDIPGSWRSDMCSRIQETCGDFLDTINDTEYPRVVHTHRSVADFLKLPEVKSQLLRYADWQESDISLAFCKALVSNCEQGIITFGQDQKLLRFRLHVFMTYAAQYEGDSGQSCADLIYRLDTVFRSRPPALQNDCSTHWICALLKPCHPSWTILEAQALPFFAMIYGLYIFVEQTIAPMTPQAAVTTLNDLLRTFSLGCYHVEDRILEVQTRPSMADVVTFLCGKGANPNAIVQTASSATVADPQTTTLTWTIWELYLQQWPLQQGPIHSTHAEDFLGDFRGAGDRYCVMDSLIEGGADLECKLPAGCTSVQQAIERRLKEDYVNKWVVSGSDKGIRFAERKRHIQTVLLGRGYVWTEADQA